jgi:prepilin-type N-terminal cleavage/methylation domain-containing protein
VTGIHGAGPLPRRGMTLVEMLVATTITLIMMGLVAQLFGVFGQGVTGSRSVIELTDQMRSVGWRLRQDLGGVTATTLPPLRPEANEGYFELFEGPATDTSTATLVPTSDNTALTADCDDALLFTTRSQGPPFVGRFIKGTIESPVAEVAWYCRPAAQQIASGPTLYTLYRRQLLVMDYVGANPANAPFFSATGGNVLPWANPPVNGSWQTFYNGNGSTFYGFDLSVRLMPSVPGPILVPNSLRDLTKRENRFGHYPTDVLATPTFPYSFVSIAPLSGLRTGEDVILNNVLGFDVRVFDPDAPVQTLSAGGGVTPGDPGYAGGSTSQGYGAYVDLCWGRGMTPSTAVAVVATGSAFPAANSTAFQSFGVKSINNAATATALSGTLAKPQTDNATANAVVYDTWSTHYESNGINENGNVDSNNKPLTDEGTNGFDDNSNGLVDEPLEAETSAPYPVPLRGIEVRIRCYEPSSRQVRQVTIRHTFVPY